MIAKNNNLNCKLNHIQRRSSITNLGIVIKMEAVAVISSEFFICTNLYF